MKIGFIGLGNMGRHMARHVVEGGHDLSVFDLSREAGRPLEESGATWAASPAEAARGADIIFTSLPMPANVLEVATGEGGVLSAISPGAVFVDLSTIDPDTAITLDAAVRAAGAHALDSPVSGGTAGAERGDLCLMVGGDRDVFERVAPVLNLIGDAEKLVYCGKIGSGSICKLANNLIGLSTGVILSEAFGMAMKAGVDARTLYDVLTASSGDSAALRGWGTSILKGDFSPGFMVDLAAKDIGLATQLGRSLGLPMEAANLAQQRFIEAQGRGWGREATPAIARIQEERAGIEFRFPEEDPPAD
ncbi:MAG: NAD(P)-dependent oxidoreductase [Chloroflexi bacterium]|nr:NAD(P)-dependent oxidoreductase [Chloroflexota bacterium]